MAEMRGDAPEASEALDRALRLISAWRGGRATYEAELTAWANEILGPHRAWTPTAEAPEPPPEFVAAIDDLAERVAYALAGLTTIAATVLLGVAHVDERGWAGYMDHVESYIRESGLMLSPLPSPHEHAGPSPGEDPDLSG